MPRVVAQRPHPFLQRYFPNLPTARPVVGQLPHAVGRFAKFENALPAGEARTAADPAAGVAVDWPVECPVLVPREIVGKLLTLRFVFFAALRAEPPHKP